MPVLTVVQTDLVGSTEMCERFGDADYAAVTDRLFAVARTATERHGGALVATTGDGTISIFETTCMALSFGDELHRELQRVRLPWTPRLRVGICRGPVFWNGERFCGGLLNRTARVCAAAAAGETVLDLDAVLDLGIRPDPGAIEERRLRGFSEPTGLLRRESALAC